ncbi:hypothetical protein [Vibrio tetraodonis]|nr:hypothetical protein [Vibrio tetraodonis]
MPVNIKIPPALPVKLDSTEAKTTTKVDKAKVVVDREITSIACFTTQS